MEYPNFEEKSMAGVYLNRASLYRDKVHLVSKYKDGIHSSDWNRKTWGESSVEIDKLVGAWKELGLVPGDRVAILAKNRPRWVSSSSSLMVSNLTFVPVYPTLTTEEIAYVLNDSAVKYIVVDSLARAQRVLEKFDELPELKKIFLMDPLTDRSDDRIAPYEDLLALGDGKIDAAWVRDRVNAIKSDDTVAIIYTSGTTGLPKGVMLTNRNFLSQRKVLPLFDIGSGAVFLNHLPFCHSFGLTADLFGSGDLGAELAIAEGLAPKQIRHALKTIRPTVLMSVPRLFEKLFVQVHQVVSQKPPAVQKLFHGALAVGKQVFDLKNAGKPIPLILNLKYKLAGRILGKVKAQAGLDRVQVAYAGGGPTSRELCYFFQSLGIDIYQGYGLTETSPVATVNRPGNNKLGKVGPPIEDVQIKIAKDGEVLIRGPLVMKGYLNQPEATAEAIDKDGWFYSGDIGDVDEDGYLSITDRKKELIITSGGKNIAPLAIESAYNTEAYIERVVVIGDNRKYLIALICPNFEMLNDWATKKGISWETDAELSSHPEVNKLITGRVEKVNEQFARHMQIKKFAVMDHIFTEVTGEATPTQKIKRRVVNEMYKEAIDALYPAIK
jgi:long-chain acyl-CoA synthetase